MVQILIFIGFVFLTIGVVYFIGATFRFVFAIGRSIHLAFASEKTVDKHYMKEVLKKSPDYEEHSKAIDNLFN